MSLGRALMRLREKRFKVEFRVGLVAPSAHDQVAMICDVSSAGLGGITTGDPINAGDRVVLVLPDMVELTATVRWSISNQFGVQFDEKQDAKQLAAYSNADPGTLPKSA